MSGIKADKWIRRKCTIPSHVYIDVMDRKEFLNADQRDPRYFFLAEEVRQGRLAGSIRPINAEEAAAWRPMLDPFEPRQVTTKRVRDLMHEDWNEEKAISYGTSSYGYDVRVADEFKVFTNVHGGRVDPKNFDEKNYVIKRGPELEIPPNGFALGRTVEYFRVPRNVLTICLGKSTYARCGIIVNVTPLEPEWEGHVTLEFSNTTNLPAVIYAGEGIAQMLFLESDEDCDESYADKGGKYQGQTGVVTPRMK